MLFRSGSITTIGTVYFREFFAVKGHNVNIIGDISVPSFVPQNLQEKTIFAVESHALKIWEDVEIAAGFSLLQANTTVEMRPGSKLRSTRFNSCNIVKNDADLFTCMDKNAKAADSLDYGNIVQRFKDQFPTYGQDQFADKSTMHFENIWGGLRANYTSYIISMNEVNFSGASIEGPRVGICAATAKIENTVVDTSGKGCPSDLGFGDRKSVV